jgi:hypothetical protein
MNEDERACFDCGRPIPIREIRCKSCFVVFVDAHPGMEVYGANLQAEGNPRGGGRTQASQGTGPGEYLYRAFDRAAHKVTSQTKEMRCRAFVGILDQESGYSELYEALERLANAAAEVLLRDMQNNRSDVAFAELNMATVNARAALAYARGEK